MEIDLKDIDQAVNISKARLEQAKITFEHASTDYQRKKVLFDEGVISPAAFDYVSAAYNNSKESLNQAQADYTRHLNMKDYTFLKAPYSGHISGIFAEAGELASPGQRMLVIIAGDPELEIFIPEHKISSIYLNMPVTVELWAYPGVCFDGVVRDISAYADKSTRTFKVVIIFKEPDERIKTGMSAVVHLNKIFEDKTAIPPSAVVTKDGIQGVWIVDNDDTVRFKKIAVVLFDNDYVYVSGWDEDALVVTAGANRLVDGQQVRTK